MTVLAVRYLRPPTVYSRAFPPTQEGIAAASRFLDDVLGKSAWREARVTGLGSTLHVILDEACSNIVKHSGATDFTLDIEIMDSPSGVRITFSDDGTAYDPLAHLDPDTTLPASERAIGGLGILMIKKMASSVQYHRSRSRNFLVVERTEQT
jgi:anti-sigma regulatory factor (Ser/Thr protein kinase)